MGLLCDDHYDAAGTMSRANERAADLVREKEDRAERLRLAAERKTDRRTRN